MTKSETRALY